LESDDQKNSATFLITHYPTWNTADLEEKQFEFIFLIDRSGSMEGAKLRYTKTAIMHLLRYTPKGSKFNIIGFGSRQD